LNCAGNIFSKSDNLLLGVVLPISLNSEFSIGLSLTFLSKVPFVPDLVFDFPVVQVTSSMSGSGVLLGDGLMVTNAHVIGNSDRCILNHGKNKGKLMKKGKTIDLALFHTDLNSTPIKKALKFIEGQKIFTVGFAVIDGHSPIVTAGYLTKVVYLQGFPLIAMINAKVFNGQSGGGVFNESFELIGIITANARSQTEGIYSDLAFCILHSTFIDFPSQSEFLFSEESESLKEIFAFQTTKMLPSPRL
jgi:S1-C subfamily serine protease